jgi:hypothetical protein
VRILPVVFRWTEADIVDPDSGEIRKRRVMIPLDRFGNVCRRQYHDGEEYPLVPLEARSRKSHNAFFAAINEGFDNLPESLAARWPTSEHMRKWLLIECGWFDEKEFEFDNQRYANSLGAFIRTEDEFARISIHKVADRKWRVIVRRAKSQAAANMGKQSFEDSKKAVLELLEHMVGVAKGDLMKEAKRNVR